MREQIERLTKLTADLLDLSQLDAGGDRDAGPQRRPRRPRPRGDARVRRPRRPARLAAGAAHARPAGDRPRRPRPGAPDHPYPARQRPHPHPRGHQGDRDHLLRQPPRRADRLRRRAGHPPARPEPHLRALLHRRHGRRLRARPGDRPRARPADGGPRSRSASSRRFTAFTLDLPPARGAERRSRRRRRSPGRRREARRSARGAAALRWPCSPAAARRRRRRRRPPRAGRPRPKHGAAGDRRDRRATASTRPRSTARPRPAWSRSARSSAAAAPPRAPASSSTPTARSSPTPTSSPTNRAAARKPAKEVFVEFPDRNVVAGRRSSASTPSPTSPCSKVEPDGFDLHPLQLGDDRDLVVGQPVAAIGSPFGEQQSLSVGIVSATDRSVESLTQFQIEGAIQTDASINPGNSGGPLLDAGARVIGINQQIETNSGANDGVGFAVPISAIKRSIAQLEAERRGRIRLHRRLQPGALPAARRQARPRHRPTAACSPKSSPAARPTKAGLRGRRREAALPGRRLRHRRRRDPLGRRPRGRRARRPRPLIADSRAGRQGDADDPPRRRARSRSRSPWASARTRPAAERPQRTSPPGGVELRPCFRKSHSARSPSPTTPTSPARRLIERIRELAEPLEGQARPPRQRHRFRRRRLGDPLHDRAADARRRPRRPLARDLRQRGVLQRDQAPPQLAAGRRGDAERRAVGGLRRDQRRSTPRACRASGTR